MVGFSKEEWLQERIRDRAERQPEFAAWRKEHPLQACIWLAFCGYADAAFEANLSNLDTAAARHAAVGMSELASWLITPGAPCDFDAGEKFRDLLAQGLSPELAFELSRFPPQKKRGRPVSNRRAVLLAVEDRLRDPNLSWMQLAIKHCKCGEAKHTDHCKQRIRIQAIELKAMLKRLGGV